MMNKADTIKQLNQTPSLPNIACGPKSM